MKITIDFSKQYRSVENRVFKTKKAALSWIMEGLFACEGAERDHYVDMLCQFNSGKRTLFY